MNIKQHLEEMADPEYKAFSASLHPNIDPDFILGIRVPQLREYAAQLIKEDGRAALEEASYDTMEETMLKGMLLGGVRMEIEEYLKRIEEYLPYITTWGICDTFCSSLKFTNLYQEEVWEFLQPYFVSDKTYEVRFAVVMSVYYYSEDFYLADIFKCLERITCTEYYAVMAVAWAIAHLYGKLPHIAKEQMEKCDLPIDIKRKACQKILESKRSTREEKEWAKKWRRGLR